MVEKDTGFTVVDCLLCRVDLVQPIAGTVIFIVSL